MIDYRGFLDAIFKKLDEMNDSLTVIKNWVIFFGVVFSFGLFVSIFIIFALLRRAF